MSRRGTWPRLQPVLSILTLVALLAGAGFTGLPTPAQAPRAGQEVDADGRVTVLLLGSDTRPRYRDGNPRTDSIMLLSVDTAANTASVLSIPRDLYVAIPGYGFRDRINSAYRLGGGELAMETVERNLGIPVDYYVLVEFDAFTAVIDEIGGVDVVVPRAINDPLYPGVNGGYDPFTIEQGRQHLDGETALKYVRTRHADSDFGRLQRQQDVLFALRDKVLSLNMLPTLIARAPALYSALAGSIHTNMSLPEMLNLAQTVQSVPRENIRSATIGRTQTTDFVTTRGASVLLPDEEQIARLVAETFGPPAP